MECDEKFNIEERLICLIENLYKNTQSAVIINGATGKFFKTTVGVRQVCLLLFFNTFQHLPRGNNESHVRKL